MPWEVELSTSAKKQKAKLPENIKKVLASLVKDLEEEGPIRRDWPNFGPLGKRRKAIPDQAYHCHLKNGKPTYVACWVVENKKLKLVEVFYVGTHENAPY